MPWLILSRMGSPFYPQSIARMKNRCAAPCKNFRITKPSEFFLHMARQFSLAPVSGLEVCSTAIRDSHVYVSMSPRLLRPLAPADHHPMRGEQRPPPRRLPMIMMPVQGGPIACFLRLIRFSHTIFALPYALGALIVAANGWPSVRILLLVIVCMVLARTAAMLFNRLVDWSLDQRNPRTVSRHLLISKLSALILLILSSGAIVASGHVSDPYWLWCSSETRRGLLLLTAPDRGSTCLRTQNRKARYRRNQPRVFPKQRVC